MDAPVAAVAAVPVADTFDALASAVRALPALADADAYGKYTCV